MLHAGGSIKYFHDNQKRELWAVPDIPEVEERMESRTKRRRNPKRLGWTAHAEITHIRADNWIRPDTNQFQFPVRAYPRQSFDAHYQLEEVRSYFNDHHRFVARGEQISFEEFERLRAAYEAEALKNPAPSPLPPRTT